MTAYAGYKAPRRQGLLLKGGLLPTQVGYEPAPVKDNLNFSRSNLFNFLPFFHLGARASYPVTESSICITAAVYNGWNQATDLNERQDALARRRVPGTSGSSTCSTWAARTSERRSRAGKPWRNLFDAVGPVRHHAQAARSRATRTVAAKRATSADTRWYAGAVYTRFKAPTGCIFAARGDGIIEKVANDAARSPLFVGAEPRASGTFTGDVRPIGDGVSFRLEYRHDDSDRDVAAVLSARPQRGDGTSAWRATRTRSPSG